MKRSSKILLPLLLSLAACSGSADDSMGQPDAGGKDATSPFHDATTDTTPSDAAPDVMPLDAGLNATSLEIQAIRTAASAQSDAGADGGTPVSLPVDNATVTYVKPLIGADVAGFFIQAQQTGPAIFVAVDPATLNPVPAPGDQVSFTATGVAVESSLREVTSLTSFTRSAQNVSLAPLLQDVSSATDLVTNLDSYESEYVTATITVASTFATSGNGFVQAQVDTAGLTGNAALNLKLRVPTTVQTAIDIDNACTAKLTGIMVRFGGVAQPSGWVTADVSALTCNAPKVVSASAASGTSVIVNFDRDLLAASLASDGSQFMFNGNLVASAASLTTARQVTVTTGAQTNGINYTVTVASSLTDTLTEGVDSSANTATFPSFATVATLQINEVNPNIGSSLDLVELLATSAGTLNGITIEQDISGVVTLATLPNLTVASGDFIVVHLGATTATSETTSKADCTDASCYSGAWDIKGGTTGITYGGHLLIARAPNAGAIQDGVAFYSGTPGASFFQQVEALQAAGAWMPVDCSGNPCSSNTLAEGVSFSWAGCGTTASGSSATRKTNVNTHSAADWAVGTSSFGLTNP